MLYVPNILWTKNKPEDYDEYAKNENRTLLLFERVGETLVSVIVLVFKDFNIHGLSPWFAWLIGAFILMILYEVFWIRYFKSEKTMADFYSSILGIPVAGATLPVVAVILLAIYGGNLFLLASGIILGMGHIGIHLQHRKEIRNGIQ